VQDAVFVSPINANIPELESRFNDAVTRVTRHISKGLGKNGISN
jgi:hypothetical protein